MSQKSTRVPSYRLHKSTGQAVVTLSGHDRYLGKHGSPESQELYRRLIAEWLAAGRNDPIERATDLTVSELLAGYWAHAESYYRHADGQPTSQLDRVRRSLAPARELYGGSQARGFDAGALQACRAWMVRQEWCRRVINQRVGCLVRAFRWGVSQGLIPASTWESLRSVEGLKAGRSAAPESEPTEPADAAAVEAALALLPLPLPDVARLQLACAARPGEALGLRACDLDCSGPIWSARLAGHKTAWRGHARVLLFGPRAQAILRRYLVLCCSRCAVTDRAYRLAARDGLCGPCADSAEERGECGPWPWSYVLGEYYLFSPAEAHKDRMAALRQRRKTPVQPSQRARRKKRPAKSPGQRYRASSYGHAVRRACDLAKAQRWHPHQLRHNAATLLVSEFGWDVARIVLGHRSVDMTRVYAQDDLAAARAAVARLG